MHAFVFFHGLVKKSVFIKITKAKACFGQGSLASILISNYFNYYNNLQLLREQKVVKDVVLADKVIYYLRTFCVCRYMGKYLVATVD